ncbi:MAG: alpha-E domain-containing protein [Geminicoccaceae bacterium]
MTNLLARYAEALFWMARYVERAENLARVLDVQETFARDSRGSHDWRAILQLYVDEERFLERYAEPTPHNVIYFYTMDPENPGSIFSSITYAKDNARALRPLISTEMWVQLNTFHQRVAALTRGELAEERLARVCAMIKDGCETHTGVTAGTFYRDEGWHFYRLGASIECADQTTRFLDVKYHNLLSKSGEAIDVSQWNAVLRSVAGYHAFRRVHPRDMRPDQVASFLLSDRRFPRSVVNNVVAIDEHLNRLRAQYGLKRAFRLLEMVDGLKDDLEPRKVQTVLAGHGLHGFNDFMQQSLSEISQGIGQAFFGYAAAEQTQTQSQS